MIYDNDGNIIVNHDFKNKEKLVKLVPVNYCNRFQTNTRLDILTLLYKDTKVCLYFSS